MVVNEQFDGIINLGSNSPGFWEVETNDGPLLTRLVDWYEGDIAEISDNTFIKGKESPKICRQLIKNCHKIFLAGVKLRQVMKPQLKVHPLHLKPQEIPFFPRTSWSLERKISTGRRYCFSYIGRRNSI
ncbi:hypothetical protein ACVRZS_07990 [Streptococcus ferus]|uniref:Uncharacterized protein n=1 Tax=Streptococcus ferus TaxID=1345 RepID=A0A2X3W755_9STRE|nr:hypothetical protein [Streptococcus ferus]SQF39603.1 Uncharacterised protein [Streptococcus ferus]